MSVLTVLIYFCVLSGLLIFFAWIYWKEKWQPRIFENEKELRWASRAHPTNVLHGADLVKYLEFLNLRYDIVMRKIIFCRDSFHVGFPIFILFLFLYQIYYQYLVTNRSITETAVATSIIVLFLILLAASISLAINFFTTRTYFQILKDYKEEVKDCEKDYEKEKK